jgi:hypothetical protein
MKANELKDKAVFMGNTILRNQHYDYMTGTYQDEINYDITYYFDADMVEIGHVVFPNDKFESVKIFPDGREWGKENLNNLNVRRIR